jgi:uncharacterized protein (DUF1330 family)
VSAYLIVSIEITDPERYAEYVRAVPHTLERFKGKYLARGGRAEKLEGEWEPKRTVLVEFETAEDAKAWWASDEYREAKAIRHAAARTNMILVQGV